MRAQHGFVSTRAATSGLLTATGAVTTHDTTVAISFNVDGKAASKAAITTGVTPTTDVVTGSAITLTANNGTVVVWCLEVGGTVRVIKGDTKALDETGNFIVFPQFPNIDYDTYCPFAYMVLKGGSTLSGTWTFGTSNWNATGMTVTIVNVHELPARPKAN